MPPGNCVRCGQFVDRETYGVWVRPPHAIFGIGWKVCEECYWWAITNDDNLERFIQWLIEKAKPAAKRVAELN